MKLLVTKPGATRALIAVTLFAAAGTLGGCNSTSEMVAKKGPQAEVNEVTKFTSAEYGVQASPRVTTSKGCVRHVAV